MSKTSELTTAQLPRFLGRCEADCGPAAPDAVGGQLMRTIISSILQLEEKAYAEVHRTHTAIKLNRSECDVFVNFG
jgi:hypothetical protein